MFVRSSEKRTIPDRQQVCFSPERLMYPLARTKPSRRSILDVFGNGPALLLEVLDICPKKMWLFRLGNQPSIHETILYLADVEAQNYVRCRQFIPAHGSSMTMYDPSASVGRLGYGWQSATDAVELIVRLRRATYRVLLCIPGPVWANTMQCECRNVMTLEAWLSGEAGHMPRYIEHIRSTHAAWAKTVKHRRARTKSKISDQDQADGECTYIFS